MRKACDIFDGYIHPKGYGLAYNPRTGKTAPAHVIAWEKVHGPVKVGLELHHKCETRSCREVEHLEEVTHLENVRKSKRVKFKPEDVAMMRTLHADGRTLQSIADEYGTYSRYVRRLIDGERGY